MKYDKEFLKTMSNAWERGGGSGRTVIEVEALASLYADMMDAALQRGFRNGVIVTVTATWLAVLYAWKTRKLHIAKTPTEPVEETEEVEESE